MIRKVVYVEAAEKVISGFSEEVVEVIADALNAAKKD